MPTMIERITLTDQDRIERAKQRGLLFVQLFAAAKQLVDNHPKRFPYLGYNVREIERLGLAPKLIDEECK